VVKLSALDGQGQHKPLGPHPKVHTVVHVRDTEQALRQVRLARDLGSDGAWLISHGGEAPDLRKLFEEARSHFPDFWLGVNFLDLRADEAMSFVSNHADGLWSDTAHIHPENNRRVAERVRALQLGRPWEGKYFGGVAFKGQHLELDPGAAAERAVDFVDVVTTSGAATGVSAPEQKIRSMYEVLAGRRPLALASGITPENVDVYLPYVEFLMVSTGVSKDFYELDPDRLARLVERVRAWRLE
jgi:hypothetical protein